MIRLSETAADDLRHIGAWLRPRAGNAVTDRVIEAILTSIRTLARHPELGRPGRDPSTRELAVPRLPYVVFYSLAGDDVMIRRVLHGAMQWPRPKQD